MKILKNAKIGEEEIEKATEILREYKMGKTTLEENIVENEQWWKLRHWDASKKTSKEGEAPVSAWLFNVLTNKHADAMESFPEASILPRERSDEKEARRLSSILPAILENNEFEETYSKNWWYKLKHGCSAYGVFWNSALEGGLGDIQISRIDLLNIFWEPGVTDIQKSKNLFIVDLKDREVLESEYPIIKNKPVDNAIDVKQYIYDDTIDTSKKTLVVDWYYKVRKNGKTLLHYCKFTGNTVLFSSENSEEYRDCGWYDHGEYPIIFDTLFPEEGTPAGFGYIAVTKDPQMYIDRLNRAILENAMMAAKPRYFAKISAGINEEEFLDWSKPIVHVEGDINEERLRPINVTQLPASCLNILNMKIEELKETSANGDFNRGSASTNGITAASAIAALQEAGNKTSRDMLKSSYRAFVKINYFCIELIRQFYSEIRSFRVTGPDGTYDFEDYDNRNIRNDKNNKTVFDIKVKAQKKSPYSRLSQNELAKELFKIGFFNPENATQSLGALELMDFEGKSLVEAKIRESMGGMKHD